MSSILYAVELFLDLLNIAIFIRVILSWLPIDRYNPLVQFLHSITEPILAPIRRNIPSVGMMDLSPIIAFFLIQVVQAIVHNLAGSVR